MEATAETAPRRRRRRPRRADVLDSSDESSVDSDHGSSHSGSLATVDSLAYSMASTSVTTNVTGNARLARNAASGGDDGRTSTDHGNNSNNNHNNHNIHGHGQEAEHDGSSSDDDDELMNPYVMNPFPHPAAGAQGGILDAAALLPPSMELASLSRREGRHGGGDERDLLPPQLSHPSSPTRTQASLASFDPYSPGGEAGAQAQPKRPWVNPQRYEMEMEEESIEFLSPAKQRGRPTEPQPQQSGGVNHLFGPLIEEPSAPSVHGSTGEGNTEGSTAHDQPSFASSFSPFPKHRPQHAKYVAGEYGENTPLAGFYSRHGRPGGGGGAVPPAGPRGLVVALADVLKALLSTVAYTVAAVWHGDRPASNPFSTSRRLNVRMARDPRRRWGTMALFRLCAMSVAAVFAVGTLTAMWNVPDAHEVGTEVANRSGYQGGGVESEGKTVVLKKLEAKKRHWWNRKHGGQQSRVEVYRDGAEVGGDGVVAEQEQERNQQQNQQGQQQQNQQQQNQQQQNQKSQSVEGPAASDLPVIVQQEEDGTLLIKLPPPKAKAQQPNAGGSVENLPPLGKSRPPPPLGSSAESAGDGEEETMYIKLPYPPQQQQQRPAARRTLTEAEGTPMTRRELDPPPLGAAMPLARRPPPPLERSNRFHLGGAHSEQEEGHPGVWSQLRGEFDAWAHRHGKEYGSRAERERRFGVWRKNHLRIKEKNEKHGPCRMTGKPVFGHNLFSDLAPEEFQSRFLSGYHGPRHVHDHRQKKDHGRKRAKGEGARESHAYFRNSRRQATAKEEHGPPPTPRRHPTIQRKLEEHAAAHSSAGGGNGRLHGAKYRASYFQGCSWWEVSCMLRWIFGYQYVGGTREPLYDADSYPSALDWRSMGVVSDVHSQGSCGACWAITAVETIESAHAIATGQLLDLDEEEVIACDGTCEMCNGGWPQNAYDYVMKHEGLPVKESEYDADWLYTITAVLGGESYEASDYEMGAYFAQVCPAGYREGEGDGSGSRKSGSGDNEYEYETTYTQRTRYGKVKGYGYATDRCVCYTDGSGCDCDDQDERTAVLNVASYGPAAVCLEASLWQDYEGGIMTSDIGCTSSFLDMNHCVEVVGYAFTDGSSDGENGEGENNSQSGSGSNDRSGSNDSNREGYWIVKNQWSNYWGMNGYAYLAMGGNTCGILNDMTQVYME